MNPCNIFDNANLNKIQQEDGLTDLQGKAMIEFGSDENREEGQRINLVLFLFIWNNRGCVEDNL